MEGQVEEANHEVPERLVRHTRSTHARVRPKVMEIAEYETSGIKVNKKGLRSTFDLAAQCPNCEFMYLRENEIREFKAPKPMYFLRVLDLSLNRIDGNCEWLALTPNLKHLYLTGNNITSLQGFSGLDELETLAISSNSIPSFDGLDSLPKLRLLSLNLNKISSFENFPLLPSLYALNLAGNPVAEIPMYRQLTIAVCNKYSLCKLDGEDIDEREDVDTYRGKVAFCMTEGFVPDGEGSIEEQCAQFLLARQQEQSVGKSLWPHHVAVESPGGRHQEGEPVVLSVCLQDMRDILVRKRNIFYSRHLFPVAFKVSGEAKEVFVMGSMNKWKGAIPLQRCKDEDGSVYFQTTLYLPAGEYEYRYLVDGMEKISEHNKTTCKHSEGMCNVYRVVPSTLVDGEEEVQETILHIRWHRSNEYNVFSLIPDENGLEYIPTAVDVGNCLRVEVLAYLDGNFHCMVCDISTPVEPGPPKVTDLRIDGAPCEGQLLKVEGLYSGGVEGNSEIRWYRMLPDGSEVPVEVENAWEGYLTTAADIGCQVKAVYIPIRSDWVTGKPEVAVSEAIIAGVPVCKSLNVLGQFMEQEPLVVEAEYSGGQEGASRFQWMREAPDSTPDCPVFEVIPGETGTTYVPCQQDVGCCLAVDYTPVSETGVEGETNRFITDEIEPGDPMLSSLEILGDPVEGNELEVLALYYGGFPGKHIVQWLRQEERDGLPTRVKVGTPGALKYVPTRRDVDRVLEVAFIPVRDDGVRGAQQIVCTNAPVAAHPPTLTSLTLEGTFALHETVRLQVEYLGGREGPSAVQWSRSTADPDVLEPIDNAETPLQYTITAEDCGRCLHVVYTPVAADDAVGQPLSVVSPVVVAAPLQPLAEVEDGPLLPGRAVHGTCHNLDDSPVAHRWIRVHPDGNEKIVCTVTHDDGASYLPTDDDVGCALVYGFRAADGGPGAGHWVYSEPTLARVGCGPPSPGRADGEAAGRPSGEGAEEPAEEEDVEGTDILLASARDEEPDEDLLPATPSPARVAKPVVDTPAKGATGSTPAPSSGGTVRLPAVAIEGVPLTPDISGVEVDFARLVVGWSRCDAAGDTKLVSRELTYTPVAEDVGCDLLCTVLPDGSLDSILEAYAGPVESQSAEVAAAPASSLDVPAGTGCGLRGAPYCGAHLTAAVSYLCTVPEGPSLWRWFVVEEAGAETLLPEARGARLDLDETHVGRRIRFEYTPVSAAHVPGTPVSALSDVIGPRQPTANGVHRPVTRAARVAALEDLVVDAPVLKTPGAPPAKPAQPTEPTLPPFSYCMKRTEVSGVEGGSPSYTWEVAPTGHTDWSPVGAWVCIGRSPTVPLTADHINHLLRVKVEDAKGTTISNNSHVVIDGVILRKLVEEVGSCQTGLNVRDPQGTAWALLLNHEMIKLKSSVSKVEIRWGQVQEVVLPPEHETEFRLSYVAPARPPCSQTFVVDKRVDRDMVALLLRTYHALALKNAADFVGPEYARRWASGSIRKLKSKSQGTDLLLAALRQPSLPSPAATDRPYTTLALLKKISLQ